MHKLKTVIVTVLLGIGLAAGITFAASLWQGTDWIADGEVISASKIKDNLDYLYEHSLGGSLLPPTCIGSDKALQWDGGNWDCATIGEPVGNITLIGSSHTEADCSAIGGNIYNTPDGYICQVVGSSCPAEWSQHKNWTTTAANRCDAYGTGATTGVCRESLNCTTPLHSFSDANVETCNYWKRGRNSYGKCSTWHEGTCVASITKVGCK